MGLIQIQAYQDKLVQRGQQLKRRQAKLRADIAFLEETILSRPWKNVHGHYQLIKEWEEEIEMLEQNIVELRKQWLEYEQHKKRKL